MRAMAVVLPCPVTPSDPRARPGCDNSHSLLARRPDRHHASRRSSSVQAMAYTTATNRHITAKPGQGWRAWAEGWTLGSWLPDGVGKNSVTGFRHESGSAWAIPGRTIRTAIMQAM